MSASGPLKHSDLSFARALAGGDAMAVLDFEGLHRSLIRHAAKNARRQWPPVEDVNVEEFTQAFIASLFADGARRLTEYGGRVPFGAWLYVAALYAFRARMRELGLQADSRLLWTRAIGDRRPPDAAFVAAAEQEADRIRGAVHALEPEARLVVRLVYVDRLDPEHASRALGREPGWGQALRTALLARLSERLHPSRPHRLGLKQGAHLRKPPDPAMGLPSAEPREVDIEQRLRVLDLQLPLVGDHLSAERICQVLIGARMDGHDARHLAGCDDCAELALVASENLAAMTTIRPTLARLVAAPPRSAAGLGRPVRVALLVLVAVAVGAGSILAGRWLSSDGGTSMEVLQLPAATTETEGRTKPPGAEAAAPRSGDRDSVDSP